MRAWLNLRHSVPERRRAFTLGLERLGFTVYHGLTMNPRAGDVLVTWNRIREGGLCATMFEARGLKVIVTENATWGNGFEGGHWYTLARTAHNMAGMFPVGGPERWDRLGVELAPWRTGGETVILPSRGIGQVGQMPQDWARSALRRFGGRVRYHPGQNDSVPLAHDLARAGRVITWGSGAAVKALAMGIPTVSEMPHWIGAQDNTDAGRLEMFRRLAWAQWGAHEIETGEPIRRLLE